MLAIGVHITFHIHFGTSIAQCPFALRLIAQNAMPEWGEDGTGDGAAQPQQHAESTQASVADAAVGWNTDSTIMAPSAMDGMEVRLSKRSLGLLHSRSGSCGSCGKHVARRQGNLKTSSMRYRSGPATIAEIPREDRADIVTLASSKT